MEKQIELGTEEINKKAKTIWVITATAVVITAVVFGGGVYWWQSSVIKKIQNENLKLLESTQEEERQLQKEEEWRRAEDFPSVAFEYPDGWHVVRRWSYGEETSPYYHDVVIDLGPEPISISAPRGAPGSIITIEDYFDFYTENQEEFLAQHLEFARENIINLQEKLFNVGANKFYILEGKAHAFSNIVPYVQYHGLVSGVGNQHVVRVTLEYMKGDEKYREYTEILDRIVRSLKI
jgi:hypothetical protein